MATVQDVNLFRQQQAYFQWEERMRSGFPGNEKTDYFCAEILFGITHAQIKARAELIARRKETKLLWSSRHAIWLDAEQELLQERLQIPAK